MYDKKISNLLKKAKRTRRDTVCRSRIDPSNSFLVVCNDCSHNGRIHFLFGMQSGRILLLSYSETLEFS